MESTALAALEQQALSKAQEWQAAEAHHIDGLREALSRKAAQLAALQARYQRLREDFVYNLGLLEQRDAELEKLAQREIGRQESLSARDRSLEDLRLQLDAAAEALAAMQERMAAQQAQAEASSRRDKAEAEERLKGVLAEAKAARLQLEAEMRQLQMQKQDAVLALEEERKRQALLAQVVAEEATAGLRAELHAAQDANVEANVHLAQARRESELANTKAEAARREAAAAEAAAAKAQAEARSLKSELQDAHHVADLRLANLQFQARQEIVALQAENKALSNRVAELNKQLQDEAQRQAEVLQESRRQQQELLQKAEALQHQAASHEVQLQARQQQIEEQAEKRHEAALAALQTQLQQLKTDNEQRQQLHNQEVRALQEANAVHEREKQALVLELSNLCQVLETAKACEAEARRALENINTTWQQQQEKLAGVESLRRSLADKEEELHQHKQVLARLQQERDEALAAAHAVHTTDNELRAQNQQLRTVAADLRGQLERLLAEHAAPGGAVQQRMVELERGMGEAYELAQERAGEIRNLQGMLEAETRRNSQLLHELESRAGENGDLRQRIEELLRRVVKAEEEADQTVLEHHHAALTARQEMEALLAICTHHAADIAALFHALSTAEMTRQDVAGRIRELLETFRQHVAAQREQFSNGTAVEAQEVALRRLLKQRAYNKMEAEQEVQRMAAEMRRMAADRQRLLDASNELRARVRTLEETVAVAAAVQPRQPSMSKAAERRQPSQEPATQPSAPPKLPQIVYSEQGGEAAPAAAAAERPRTAASLLSSMEGMDEQLAAVWRLVDTAPATSADLARAETPRLAEEDDEPATLQVVGSTVPAQQRPPAAAKPGAAPPPKAAARESQSRGPRNYNVRDV